MRVAVAQTPGTRLEEWRATRALLEDLVVQAADRAADLVVLPECVWPAYCLSSKRAYEEARAAGLPGPEEFLARMARLARERHIAVCAGFVAENEGRLLNAAVLIDADGHVLGMRHKCFLWAFDRDCFEAGTQIEPVAAPFGRIGVMICADARVPEIPATLAARGAELILQPTAWVNAGTAEAPWNPQPDFLIPARAMEFGVPVASASKWGAEGETAFVGSSLICDADGCVLAQCGPAETRVIVADVQPRPARPPRVSEAEQRMLLSGESQAPPRAAVAPLEVRPLPPEQGIALVRARNADKWQAVPGGGKLEVGGVRIGVLAGEQVRSFAPARCLALQGAHVVVVQGEAARAFLQARACENRMFVVAVDERGWCAIDPRGRAVREGRWCAAEETAILLDVAQAANKAVAPRTDMIAGRRPEQYGFNRR
jgi:predicted amidohydrolase